METFTFVEKNLYFCKFCRNVMVNKTAKTQSGKSQRDKLLWECSIKCELSEDMYSKHKETIEDETKDKLVLLSETSIRSNIQDYPLDDNVIYNPTLLRCQKWCDQCREDTETIIFKKNEMSSENLYICVECARKRLEATKSEN